MLLLLLSLFIFAPTPLRAFSGVIDESWDVDDACQPYVQSLAKAYQDMVLCAVTRSAPPKVCSNCLDQYIAFKQAEYDAHHLFNVTSLINTTCSDVIYGYALSYADDISKTLTNNVWENSDCGDCLVIDWDFVGRNSTIKYDEKTYRFEKLLLEWRRCINNSTSPETPGNFTAICNDCMATFNALFDYYWKIYTDPDVRFCMDVETTMNSTLAMWEKVWGCPDDAHKNPNLNQDIIVVGFATAMLCIIIALFYAGSYIQTESAQRDLIQYSRLRAPRGQRSRLLSSSGVETPSPSNFNTPSSSVQGW